MLLLSARWKCGGYPAGPPPNASADTCRAAISCWAEEAGRLCIGRAASGSGCRPGRPAAGGICCWLPVRVNYRPEELRMASSHRAGDVRDAAAKQARRSIWSGVLAGAGLVAFIDETVFHQLLH